MHQTFQVSGMRCGHCRASITDAIGAIDPRAQVVVNLETGEVTVTGSTLSPGQIAAAIEELGFGVSGPSTFAGNDR